MNVATTSSVSSIVAGWLSKSGGESGPSAAEPASSSAPSLFAPRPERLGLGAKFLSHSQAMPLHEQQFAKKLKQQVEKREREERASRQMVKQSKLVTLNKKKRRGEANQESEDDDEESRTAAFKQKRKGSSNNKRQR